MALRYAKKWRVLLYAVLAVIKSLQIVFVAYMFQRFIDFAHKPQGSLIQLMIFAIVGMLAFGIMSIAYQSVYTKIVQEVNLNIKAIAANYMVKARAKEAAVDISFMTNDLKQLETGRIEAELEVIFNAIQFIAAIVAALVSAWLLAIIFLIASFAPAIAQSIFGPRIEAKSEVWEANNRQYTNTVNDTANGLAIANLYDVEPSIISRLLHAAQKMETSLRQTNFLRGTANEMTMVCAYIGSIFIPFTFGIYWVTQGQITLGTFMMIVQLANNFINPVVTIFSYVNDMKTAAPIWKQFKRLAQFQIPTLTPQVPTGFEQLVVQDAGVQRGQQQIFNHVNLTVHPGDKVLLVAPSGWGKSTLLNVLMLMRCLMPVLIRLTDRN
ncbi:MAG: ABC transporter transmembrane domain-containing protein [Lactobacillus sp.]